MTEPTIDELLGETDRRLLGYMASMGSEYYKAVRAILEEHRNGLRVEMVDTGLEYGSDRYRFTTHFSKSVGGKLVNIERTFVIQGRVLRNNMEELTDRPCAGMGEGLDFEKLKEAANEQRDPDNRGLPLPRGEDSP